MTTANKYLVGARGHKVVIGFGARTFTPNDARNLAAWLLVMAEATDLAVPNDDEPAESFEAMVKAIRAS